VNRILEASFFCSSIACFVDRFQLCSCLTFIIGPDS
jgi:hypothetical protein